MRRIPISSTLLLSAGLLVLVAAAPDYAQTKRPEKPAQVTPSSASLRASGAFAEVALRYAEFEAELESLLVEYTEDFPKVKELRFGLKQLTADKERILKMPPEQSGAATVALGKLIVKKVDAEIELWKLQENYADGHPDVKRAKRKVEIFEKAIKEILG